MNNLIKKIAVSIVAVLILSSIPHAFAAGLTFPDVNGHWAQSYIEALAEKQIVAGMGDGMFHPNSQVTTAQFVKMIIQCGIGDIPPINDHWASGYMNEAYNLDIINGNDLDTLDAPLLRRDAARIGIGALINLWGEQAQEDIYAADALEDLYICSKCVWTTAQFYVKGIMVGMPDNKFHGDDSFTRAEACIVIMRLIDPSLRVPQKIALPEDMENGKITADETLRLSGTYQNVMLIDVRSAEEYAKGHILNSLNIPLDDILNDLSETGLLNFQNFIIIVYCREGPLALRAYVALKDADFSTVYNLGGIDDWPYEIV